MEYYYDYIIYSWGGIFRGVIWLVLFIWATVCMWKIFKKAGRKWRESLIPIRNIWVLFKISGHKKRFRCTFIICLIWFIVSIIFRFLGPTRSLPLLDIIKSLINLILGICAAFLPIIAIILLCLWLAKNFGKHRAFWLGLLFLSPIFMWILAFDDSKYSA